MSQSESFSMLHPRGMPIAGVTMRSVAEGFMTQPSIAYSNSVL